MIERADPDDALFHRDGDWLVPTALTQGPWNPEHQHGGAVCAALAWGVEREPAPVPMRAARIAFDLMHAAPIAPVRIESRVVRAGRRVQLVDVALVEGERAVARASALRVRVADDLDLDDEGRGTPVSRLTSHPDDVMPMEAPRRFGGPLYVPGFIRAVELRRTNPNPRNGEPAVGWARLCCRVVAGEDPSPLVRLSALADFVSGLANGLDFTRYVSINPDLILHVERPPESDWIAIEAVTEIAADGVGLSHGTLHDLRGPVARATTSLYVAPR